MNREYELNKLKSKPDKSFCSCGLGNYKERRKCKHKSCQEDAKHTQNVNDLVERGWLPLERWRHV
ncbi:hypothetical protein [Christiangramia forsetii]|uniref:SWIM-type domain-containing protein n=1 Tax=Christiangramia forsetii TaxID=411153 RepID=A0ABQ1WB19_9FLAO|nr:hypothetical protein [Christiangramia forsetii]GGG24084.1 hypothetical protein GCM10011532_04140 [Christiangramia forsetii]